jgi:antitoxin PrlF
MITSRITSKAQTTVPQAVRVALGVREGDELAYELHDGHVVLTKARRVVEDDPFAEFHEWNSEVDRKGYANF